MWIHFRSTRGCAISPHRLQKAQTQENVHFKHPPDPCDIFLVSRCCARCRRGAAGTPLAQTSSSSTEVRPPAPGPAPGTPGLKFSDQPASKTVSWQLYNITDCQNSQPPIWKTGSDLPERPYIWWEKVKLQRELWTEGRLYHIENIWDAAAGFCVANICSVHQTNQINGTGVLLKIWLKQGKEKGLLARILNFLEKARKRLSRQNSTIKVRKCEEKRPEFYKKHTNFRNYNVLK